MSQTMTITEALSQVNLVKKKLDHKKKAALQLLVRAEHVKDPYESEGGTKEFLKRELQAIDDLHTRLRALTQFSAHKIIQKEVILCMSAF